MENKKTLTLSLSPLSTDIVKGMLGYVGEQLQEDLNEVNKAVAMLTEAPEEEETNENERNRSTTSPRRYKRRISSKKPTSRIGLSDAIDAELKKSGIPMSSLQISHSIADRFKARGAKRINALNASVSATLAHNAIKGTRYERQRRDNGFYYSLKSN